MNELIQEDIGEHKKKNYVLFFFIFTIMFSFEIAGYSMRYIVIIFWTFYSFMITRKIYVNLKLMIFPIALILIITYSYISTTLNGTNNSFEMLRNARALSTYFLIILFLSSRKYKINQILHTLSNVLLLHGIIIILGIVFPSVKNMVLPISQYTKEFMTIRSSGFLSGYDDAGFLCNVGLIMALAGNSINKKKLVNARAIVFIIAVIFTSRFNIVLMTIILLITFLYSLKKKNFKGVINIGKYVIVLGVFIVIILTLTTSISGQMRSQLFSEYPILDKFYSLMSTSYTDYGVHTSVISRHANIKDLNFYQFIFGMGLRRTESDIGYIKTIYSIGVIGIFIQTTVYLKSILYIRKIGRVHLNNYSIQIFSVTFIAAVIFMFAMESKNSFIVSSTTFEMLSIIYITSVLSSMKLL